MKKSNLKLGFAILFLIVAILACDFSASTANISDAKMTKDYDGTLPTSVYSQDEVFYCVVQLSNAPDDTTVKASWIAVEVEGAEPDFLIDEVELTSGSAPLHFELSNDNLWPVGKYKVELYLNGELDSSLEFEVQ